MLEKSEAFEANRYSFFSKHPGLGALILIVGLAIPAGTILILALSAPDFFFGGLAGRLVFAFIVACAAGIGAWVFTSLRKRLVERAAEDKTNAQ